MKGKDSVKIKFGTETPMPKNNMKSNESNNSQNSYKPNQNQPTEIRGNQTPVPKPTTKQSNGSQSDGNKKS
jgi:hypothetical protein